MHFFSSTYRSDVERLIGEGAVRTVKKPTQMKKQLLSDGPPAFPEPPKEEVCYEAPHVENEETSSLQYSNDNDQDETHNMSTTITKTAATTTLITTTTTPTMWNYDTASQSSDPVADTEIISSPLPDVDKQPDFADTPMDDTGPVISKCTS